MVLWLLAVLLAPPAIGAAVEAPLPPARPWSGASEALIVSPEDPWVTPSEKTGLTETPGYDETIAYLRRLETASPLVALREFGRTAEGRALYVMVAARGRAFTPEALRQAGRPTLLVQGGIHSGEIDGKDAGLMLLRDIALRGKASLLERANLLFVPVFNADGHERASRWSRPNQRGPVRQGWRTTAQNLNLNRDYMKADAPEMQAMLRLIRDWSPSLYLDLHVTDGLDHQYDVTFGYNGDVGGYAWSPRIARWLEGTFRPEVETALKAAGHFPGRFYDEESMVRGVVSGTAMPRYSHGYGDLRHLPTILVECHSLKPYRQRVLGTYVLVEAALKTLGAGASEVAAAIAADRGARPSTLLMNDSAPDGDPSAIDFQGIAYETYLSPASGRKEVRWLGTPKVYPALPLNRTKPKLSLRRPKAYWVPVSKPDVIGRLRLHGIQLEVLSAARTNTLEMYRLENLKPQPGSGVHPFEGRHTLTTGVKAEQRTEVFPAGSVRVPTDQPLGDLAMALLEPEGDDSLFAWGFFLEVLQRTEYMEGYVLAPMAERMLAEDPALQAAFEAKLAAEPAFAANPTARLQWFYQRSPYYDARHLLYPVGIER